MDLGETERQGTNIMLVLLDWEKAFGRIDQSNLIQVLQLLSVPQNIVNTIQNIYRNAKLRVVRGDVYSTFRIQRSGIRQGCPLSPYLFSILMSAVFQDIRANLIPPNKSNLSKVFVLPRYSTQMMLCYLAHTHSHN